MVFEAEAVSMKLLRGGGRNLDGRSEKVELGRGSGSSDNTACWLSCGPWVRMC